LKREFARHFEFEQPRREIFLDENRRCAGASIDISKLRDYAANVAAGIVQILHVLFDGCNGVFAKIDHVARMATLFNGAQRGNDILKAICILVDFAIFQVIVKVRSPVD